MEELKSIINQKTANRTFKIKKPGKYVFFILNSGGNFHFSIESKNCDVRIIGLFVLKGNESYSIKTIQHHKKRESTSNLIIKSVLKDKSKFDYKGLIRIEPKAQKSFAYQRNENILLSDKAVVFSEPFLEIMANDVYCTHGSATGPIDKEKIIYLKTRGLNENLAKKLLIEGFCLDLVNKIKDIENKNIKNFVLEKIQKEIEKI